MKRGAASARFAAGARFATAALIVASAGSACGGSAPETRYYQLTAPIGQKAGGGDAILTIEPLQAEGAYDDDRIVYRTSPYRLDFYHYHRWSAPPGALVADYLEQALEASGHFRAVFRAPGPRTGAVLGGRLIAIEEVDASRTRWIGRIVVELHLRDAATGEIIWSRQFEERQPLDRRSPEGLARGISIAAGRIAVRLAPDVARIALARSAGPRASPSSSSPSRDR